MNRLSLAASLLVLGWVHPAAAQELVGRATPLTAWIDLRTAQSAAQTVPAWVESVEFRGRQEPAGPAKGSRTVYRIRISRPAAATDDLQIRLLFDDRSIPYGPEVTAWDELGTELIRSGPLGEGFDLPSSETLTFPMRQVSYLEIEAPGDGSAVRGVFLTWLARTEIRQAADFHSGETVRAPFHLLPPRRARRDDSSLFGVVTATLQGDPVSLKAPGDLAVHLQFELERQPLVAVVTYEALGATVDAPPEIAVNGRAASPSAFLLPELADPGFQGVARALDPGLAFRYTGWLRGQKVIPGSQLRGGLNDLTLLLSNGSESLAVRAVEIQLKYDWEKFDYLLSPTLSSPAP